MITWLEVGDKNSFFFHKFPKHCRNIKSIWELKNDEGLQILEMGRLQQMDFSHFETLYKDGGNISVKD